MSNFEVDEARKLYEWTPEQVLAYMASWAGEPKRVQAARDVLDAKTAEANVLAAEANSRAARATFWLAVGTFLMAAATVCLAVVAVVTA